ncbi:hypothetical protein PUMCH_003187 [Australozyma saopauloensis]|uniref:RRM domain-containing protein n=1 Tax=Australozyma saopauloensis TaxID=291208 RepID=A0AAX4HBR3_9ASCO|nr:hypothetical protein PUMCH_003187 [[Candida] saopauloensis]
MSYYDPFHSMPQQFMAQPYYQMYSQGSAEQPVQPQLDHSFRARNGYDFYPQYGGEEVRDPRLDETAQMHNPEVYEDKYYMNSGSSESDELSSQIQRLYLHDQVGNNRSFQEPISALSQTSFGLPGEIAPSANNSASDFLFNGNTGPSISQAPNQTAQGQPPSRTVYLGNIPSDIEPNELLDYVRSGILENVKILPSKNCAFISFVDQQSALLFHSDCILKKLNIKGNDIRVGWGKNSQIQPAVKEAIQRDGATRNVYLGNLHNPVTGQMISEEELREDLSCYGVIDCIKIIAEKGIAFIHFLSILSAVRCVSNLPLKDKYLDKKCFYGKDRCAFITKTQQHNAAQYLGLAPGMEHVVTAADREFISSALVQQSAAAAQIATQAGGANNLGNRTVYLGNLHQDSSVEEICNVVRGGLLQSIRFLKERHVCFITFIDPIAAAQFFAMCQLHGLTIHNRRIKVGWGKHSGPLSNALSLAVSNGASRNIYVGNITNFDYFNYQKLREDFSTFGDIEQINYLEEKNCAFINFVNIANAIKAIDGIKSLEDYKSLKINFGKDRCGNLPRQFQNLPQSADSYNGPRGFSNPSLQPQRSSESSLLSESELLSEKAQGR